MTLTLDQVGDILHGAPGINAAFVAQFEHSEEYDSPIRKQGGSGFEKSIRRYSEFRVWLRSGDKGCDHTCATLGEALRTAFQGVAVEMPKILETV